MTSLQVVLILNILLELVSTMQTVPSASGRITLFLLVFLLLLLGSFLVGLADHAEKPHVEVPLLHPYLFFPHVDWEIHKRAKVKE